MRPLRQFGLAILLLGGSIVAFGQPAGTAKPVGGAVLVKPSDFKTDDVPVDFMVLFGCTGLQSTQPGEPRLRFNKAQLSQSFRDLKQLGVPLKGIVSLGGAVQVPHQGGGSALRESLDSLTQFVRSNTQSNLLMVAGSEIELSVGKRDSALTDAWTNWVTQNSNLPIPARQSGLNAVYDRGKDVWIVLDTLDPKSIDVDWLKNELKRAQDDTLVQRLFVFGARPLTSESAPLPSTDRVAQAVLALEQSDKVVAYFCGSPSLVRVAPVKPGSRLMQVVVGNSGSELDSKWKETGAAKFGFSLVVTFASGEVALVPFGRKLPPEGQPIDATGPEALQAARSEGIIHLWSKKGPPIKKV